MKQSTLRSREQTSAINLQSDIKDNSKRSSFFSTPQIVQRWSNRQGTISRGEKNSIKTKNLFLKQLISNDNQIASVASNKFLISYQFEVSNQVNLIIHIIYIKPRFIEIICSKLCISTTRYHQITVKSVQCVW